MHPCLPFFRRSLLRLACALGVLCSPSAGAAGFDPLPTRDLNPLTQIHGLPAFEGARLLAPGQRQARVSVEAASHFLMQQSATETLVLDGETHRISVTFRFRTPAVEWGVEIPYLRHTGGFLDSFIEGWHEVFALPQSGRDQSPRDRLEFFYRRQGETRVHLESATGGVGDVRLLAAWPLAAGRPIETAVRASLKLPTGDAGSLHGSGAPDLALSLAAGCPACGAAWGWNAAAGLLLLGRGDVLPELQRSAAVYTGAGVGWRALPAVVLKAELRAHTPLYRGTDVRALDRTGVQLILGGSWAVGAKTVLDLAVTEDVRVETAPDVGFLLSLSGAF